MKKAPFRLALIPILSLIGTSAAVYLSQRYYAIKSGTAGFKSLCNINEAMNCDVVASSRWAELFSGLPLSSLVAGWFVALLIISLMARVDTWRKESVSLGILMSGFGSLYSIVLLFVMAMHLQTFCLFCLVIDGVNFLLLALFLSLKEGPLFEGLDGKKLKNYGILTAICLLVMTVVSRPADTKTPSISSDEIAAMVESMTTGTVTEMKIPENAPFLGNANAKITIVEFSDFQCPYCKQGAFTMHSLLNKFGNDIRVVYRPFPLDQACNRVVKSGMHPLSCGLARAALCARFEGKFGPIYEEIFDSQETLKASSATNIPVSLGLDEAKMKACTESEETKKYLGNEIEEGIRVGVQSTPTFFLNGRKIDGAYPREAWEKAIQKLLDQK